jgi:hypothetical protein
MSSDRAKALFYSSLLALQFGLQPLLTTKFTAAGVSKSSMVIGAEIAKILIAIVTLAPTASKDRLISSWKLQESLYYAAVPAVLYAVQNLLVQFGYTLLDSMTFNLLNQTKVCLVIKVAINACCIIATWSVDAVSSLLVMGDVRTTAILASNRSVSSASLGW